MPDMHLEVILNNGTAHILLSTCATESMLGLLLNQNGFTFEDLQSLLETCKFGLATTLPLGIWLSLGNTHLVKLGQILNQSIQLCLHTFTVGCSLCSALVKACCLFRLILNILSLACLGDFIHIRHFFIFGHRA